MVKKCWKVEKESFRLFVVFDENMKTLKWSLFFHDQMLDAGEMSEIAQINPAIFIVNFANALFETFETILPNLKIVEETA